MVTAEAIAMDTGMDTTGVMPRVPEEVMLQDRPAAGMYIITGRIALVQVPGINGRQHKHRLHEPSNPM